MQGPQKMAGLCKGGCIPQVKLGADSHLHRVVIAVLAPCNVLDRHAANTHGDNLVVAFAACALPQKDVAHRNDAIARNKVVMNHIGELAAKNVHAVAESRVRVFLGPCIVKTDVVYYQLALISTS